MSILKIDLALLCKINNQNKIVINEQKKEIDVWSIQNKLNQIS